MASSFSSISRLASAVILLFVLTLTAQAHVQSFGSFSVDDAHPEFIALDGEIDAGAALDFHRARYAAPNAKIVILNSPGGAVQIGLIIAEEVHRDGLSTYIPKEAGCYSACAYIFFAGIERRVDGELGVHQIASKSDDLVSAQLNISDIIDVLSRFNTPTGVFTVMFQTPPEEMHVFSPEEVARLRINRQRGEIEVLSAGEGAPTEQQPQSDEMTDLNPSSATASTTAAPDHLSTTELSKLSAIEDYARRPTRIAVFAGLDFFGDDIASKRTDDAAACARECLSMSDQCKAFTFNTDPHIARGPNCFLKSSRGTADGNAVAVSGVLLTDADPDPKPFSMGVIDPKAALFKDVDLLGGDLSSRPYGSDISGQQCRLACVANDRCIAFTYIERNRECWLKGSTGNPRYADGMVTGVKKMERFSPATIISLE